MALDILISSEENLGFPRGNLEDDIDDILDGLGEVSGGGQGISGWNIDIEIFDKEDIEPATVILRGLLKKINVSKSTSITVFLGSNEVYDVAIYDE